MDLDHTHVQSHSLKWDLSPLGFFEWSTPGKWVLFLCLLGTLGRSSEIMGTMSVFYSVTRPKMSKKSFYCWSSSNELPSKIMWKIAYYLHSSPKKNGKGSNEKLFRQNWNSREVNFTHVLCSSKNRYLQNFHFYLAKNKWKQNLHPHLCSHTTLYKLLNYSVYHIVL